jgi:hypothetical protein
VLHLGLKIAQHRPELVEGRLKGAQAADVVRQAHHGGSGQERSTFDNAGTGASRRN